MFFCMVRWCSIILHLCNYSDYSIPPPSQILTKCHISNFSACSWPLPSSCRVSGREIAAIFCQGGRLYNCMSICQIPLLTYMAYKHAVYGANKLRIYDLFESCHISSVKNKHERNSWQL